MLWGTHLRRKFQAPLCFKVLMCVCECTCTHTKLIPEQQMAGKENSFCSLKLAPAVAISTGFHNTHKYIHTLLEKTF